MRCRVLDTLRDAVSSATYRIHPDLEEPENDLYSPAHRARRHPARHGDL